jgi:hypothetical protein
MGMPVRLALLVLVYHVVKTLVVVKICPAREQIPDAVWHSGKELVSADVGYLSDHKWCDLGLGHVCVVLCCVVMTLERRVTLFPERASLLSLLSLRFPPVLRKRGARIRFSWPFLLKEEIIMIREAQG